MAELESDIFKIAKIKFRKVCKFYRLLYGDGQVLPVAKQNVCKIRRILEPYLQYFKKHYSQTLPFY